MKPNLSVVAAPGDGIDIFGPERPLIPPGKYEVRLINWETARVRQFNGSPRVYLHFNVLLGQYAGTRLFASFRVRDLKGKPQRRGGFTLSRGSELLRQLAAIGLMKRSDRPSLEPLKKVVLQVQVETVTRNSRGRQIPEALQYSRVSEMLNVQAGSIE